VKRALFFCIAVTVLTPTFAEPLTITLPSQTDGFRFDAFDDVAGIVSAGQTLPLDLIFQNAPVRMVERSTIGAELQLLTGPHNPPNPNGDFPYSQYVVFGPGTNAWIIMADGSLVSPSQIIVGILAPTPEGPFAGIALATLLPNVVTFVNGFHYDLVLPNDGKTLFTGETGVFLTQVGEADPRLMLAVGFIGLLLVRFRSFGRQR
jgi:hypothetical protein